MFNLREKKKSICGRTLTSGNAMFSLQQLHDAVSKEDLPLCILLLAHCCTKDVSAASDDADGFSPLHVSCSLGNIVITQLLIWVRVRYYLSTAIKKSLS